MSSELQEALAAFHRNDASEDDLYTICHAYVADLAEREKREADKRWESSELVVEMIERARIEAAKEMRERAITAAYAAGSEWALSPSSEPLSCRIADAIRAIPIVGETT